MVVEAEYDAADGHRAKAANEQAWLEFEVRMRALMQAVLRPIVEMSTVDRESMYDQETRQDRIDKRLEMLDSAVFKPDNTKGRTIFDDYQELLHKIQNDNIDGINQMRDVLSETTRTLYDKFFQ